MAKAKPVFQVAQFKPDEIGWLAGSFVFTLVVGTLITSATFDSTELQDLIRGFGRLLQIVAGFVLVSESISFVRTGVIGKSGTFSGACPYCGSANELAVRYPTQPSSSACSKCGKRFVLKDGKFYQLDSPRRLDAKFSAIKNGIGLVHKGITAASWVPLILVVGLFLGFATRNLLAIAVPIVLLLVSVTMQVYGVWQCLQTPDQISAKNWITATVWLEGATILLLVGKFFFWDAAWLDFLLNGTILGGQVAFLTFLKKLCTFVQRGDVGENFEGVLVTVIITFGGFLVQPLIPDSYQTPLFIVLALSGARGFFSYLSNLKQLEIHIDKALNAS